MNASDPLPNGVLLVPSVLAPLSHPPRNSKAHMLQVIMVLGYGVMCVLSLALVAHLRHNRSDALKGNSSAARRVLLPAFEPLLWILGLTTGLFTVTLFSILVSKVFDAGQPKLVTECFYCGRQFVFLLVVVFMHQKSVSIPALRRCVLISFLLATYTIPFVVYTSYWGSPRHADLYFQIQRGLRLVLVAWYVYIFVRPPTRASKRSIREFCGFTFVYQAFSLTASELSRSGYYDTGYTLTNCALLWAAFCPLVIWRVLRADTEYWRGLGQRACGFQQKHPVHEHLSSQGLHVLIEMHRKLVIDFAYLELQAKIGTGASAVVYSGVLHSRTPVAAKVYTPLALTDDVVGSFSQEAALCGSLHHPNVVSFYGMCVCPPTICLVFELCLGSLESVLRATNQNHRTHANRQWLSINVGYMIDAARAVAYLHSFQPGLLHRDIKPANFLVDSEHNVKLADFGESRSVGTHTAEGSDRGVLGSPRGSLEHVTPELRGVIVPSPTVLEMRETAQRMTVKGTVDYMAPELINGKGGFACYGEAADVYSLAMTMWDILHPGEERYPGCSSSHLHVFQAVLDGKRPTLGEHVPPMLRDVIASAWHVDPRLRPSAQVLVTMLEGIQEEVCAAFLLDGLDDLGVDNVALLVSDEEDTPTRPAHSSTRGRGAPGSCNGTFPGYEVVEHLVSHRYVASQGEALRMGRMWLDAGFLHHVKHAQTFTNDQVQFYLDEEHIRLCHPIEGGEVDPPFDGSSSKGLGARTHSSSVGGSAQARLKSEATTSVGGRGPMCACRKYGQRQLHDVKPSRRQRFKRKKFQTITETNVLTTSLLTPDDGFSSGPPTDVGPSFTDFDWHNSGDLRAV